MGYTHYWEFKDTSGEPFKEELVNQVKQVVQDYKEILEIMHVNKNEIVFNGINENSHESFVVDAMAGKWAFCKTAHKPYDVPVCIVLLLLRHHYPNTFELSSDGDIDSYGWLQAINYVETQYKYAVTRCEDPYMFEVKATSHTVHELGAKLASAAVPG